MPKTRSRRARDRAAPSKKAESRAETGLELGRVETTRFLDQSETPHRLSAQKKTAPGEGNVRGSAYPRVARVSGAPHCRATSRRARLFQWHSATPRTSARSRPRPFRARVKSASPSSAPAMAAPNAEKLAAALDDVAGVIAAARDAAESKLDAASAKDAPGLCAALPDRRGPRVRPRASPRRRDVRAQHPPQSVGRARRRRRRRRRRRPANPPRRATRRSRRRALRPRRRPRGRPSPPRRLPPPRVHVRRPRHARRIRHIRLRVRRAPSALVDDVVAAAANILNPSPGLLLAAHVAALPFQYFRDLTVAREAPPPALERLCFDLVAPRVVPVATPRSRPSPKTPRRRRASRSRRSTASFARTCPRRFVRSLRDVACAIDAVARRRVPRRDEPREGFGDGVDRDETRDAARRGARVETRRVARRNDDGDDRRRRETRRVARAGRRDTRGAAGRAFLTRRPSAYTPARMTR